MVLDVVGYTLRLHLRFNRDHKDAAVSCNYGPGYSFRYTRASERRDDGTLDLVDKQLMDVRTK